MVNALVIGGGIAGAVTAMALRKAGITSTIHEAYPTGADDIGAFLTIMNNGIDALRAVDAHQPVIDNSFAANTIDVFDSDGALRGSRTIGADDDINGPRTLTRATLYRTLHDEAARRGITVEHGKRLVHATTNGRVTATFADGTHAEADILIGAYDVPSTPTWHTPTMVLVGDAASPAAGQGASMALEDSVILAQCLRDHPTPDRAFRAYEERRRPRVERLVAASAEQGARSTRGPAPEESRDWLYRHHIEW